MTTTVNVVDLSQSVKAALAGAIAWVVAVDVLDLDQPFLAPWAAVLVVHATIYRTVSRGGQQVTATFGGVVLAWACGWTLGTGGVAMGVLLVVAFLVGRLRWWREESTTLATTGLVVLATNAVFHVDLLVGRLLDTTVGVVVGLLVNLLVFPPLRDRAAWERADQLPHELAGVLARMAEGLDPDLSPEDAEQWTRDLNRVDERIDEAWRLLGEAQESSRMNPRPSQPSGLDDLRWILHRLDQAVADTASMARTISISAQDASMWDTRFREVWRRLLRDTAEATRKCDDEGLRDIRSELRRLADELSTDTLPGSAWHEYGGLLVTLRNVLIALTDILERLRRRDPTARRIRRRPVRGRAVRSRAVRGRAGAPASGSAFGRGPDGYRGRDDHPDP